MRPLLLVLGVLGFGMSAIAAGQTAPPPLPSVKAGDQAPDFTLHYLAPMPDGKYAQQTVSLDAFKGKKTVILAFFPAAFSPG